MKVNLNRKPQLTKLDIKEWGDELYLRPVTTRQLLEIGAADEAGDSLKSLQLVALYSVCDEEGCLVFGEADLDGLADQPFYVYQSLMAKFQQVNKLTEKAIRSAKKK